MGNFYFPWGSQSRPDSWNYGYLVNLSLDEKIEFELIPYVQTVESVILRDKKEFEKEIEQYNDVIRDDQLLEQRFEKYITDNEYYLKTQVLPSFLQGKYMSIAARHGWLGKLYKGKALFSLKNKLTCESHYETLQHLFKILTK